MTPEYLRKVDRPVTLGDRCIFYDNAPPEALTIALSSRLHFCECTNKVCTLALADVCSSQKVLGL